MSIGKITLEGPDSALIYRVVKTIGTLTVRPGFLYTEDYVQDQLLRWETLYEVTIIQPTYKEDEVDVATFQGDIVKSRDRWSN